MEPSAIERDLDELETRMERLRALYEQYFMGLEKLEPQIPRKEVERRMHLLRKEQIRNTALRFKFQMLIQRYNTLQQYWARVTREIENGTYRRDVMRAAARFGAKDALTILGKRRAQKYAALAAAQAQRKEKGPSIELAEEEVELDPEDLIDDEGESSVRVAGTLDNPATFLPLVTPDPAQPAWARRPDMEPLPAVVPPPRPAVPAPSGLAGLRWGASPRRPASQPQLPRALLDEPSLPAHRSAEAPDASTSPDPKSAIRSTEDAIDASAPRTGVKRRVAELAEAMRATASQGPAAASPRGSTPSFSALDLDLEESREVEQAVGAPPQPSPPAEVRAPSRPSSFEVRASKSAAAIAPPGASLSGHSLPCARLRLRLGRMRRLLLREHRRTAACPSSGSARSTRNMSRPSARRTSRPPA
jgi:hypothetical protein